MANSIEKVSLTDSASAAPVSYENLDNLESYLEKMRGEDIESIIQKVMFLDREIQYERKVNSHKSKEICQDEHDKVNATKVKALLNKVSLVFEGSAVALHTAAAVVGPGGIYSALAQACTATSQYQKERTNSKVTGMDHRYQVLSSLHQTLAQDIQTAEREHQQDSSMIDRLVQSIDRLFQLMISSSA